MIFRRVAVWYGAVVLGAALGWAGVAQAAIPSTERQTLIDLYNSTAGAGWGLRTNWRNAGDTDFNAAGTECTWYGVTCDGASAHVMRISLSSNNLDGVLPELSALTSLAGLGLQGNKLKGSLPSLSALTVLQYLYVNDNQLTGSIPPLAGLSRMQSFYVQNNQLTGSIPALTVLSQLYSFYAGNNQLTGEIPSLNGLSNLGIFDVQGNQLTGAIPSLTGLNNLISFKVASNQLTGVPPAPPSSLSNPLSRLCPNQLTQTPSAAWDTATGSTPWYTGCTAALTSQTITNFAVAPGSAIVGGHGALSATGGGSAKPVVFGSNTPAVCTTSGTNGATLAYVGAGTCVVTADQAGDGTAYNTAPQVRLTITVQAGTVPASERQVLIDLYNSTAGAGWLRRAYWRNAADTDFNAPGTECAWYGVICDAASAHVIYLRLNGNNLVGTLPALSGLPELQWFYVNTNLLTGNIPSLQGLTALQVFHGEGNQLTGNIPSLTGLTALKAFYVNVNQLTGNIPSLQGLTALSTFNARSNKLTGSIPSLVGLNQLADFDVVGNQLDGSIGSLQGLTALTVFLVSNNRLTGSIPSLQGLTALSNFDASYNRLTGSIPSLQGLTALKGFGVVGNQLTGSIPSLAGLDKLTSLYVALNQLTGAVPAVPSPTNSLMAKASQLCPNQLLQTDDAAWDTATGQTPHWYSTCTTPLHAQAITNFAVAPTSAVVGGQGTLSATGGGSASPLVFGSNTPAICTTSGTNGGTVTYVAAGTCVVTADQAGDAITYNSAPQVQMNIVVTGTGAPPAMGNVPDQSGKVGVALSLNLAGYVTATNGDAITGYGYTGTLPPGVGFNAASGVISGTPTTAGTYTISVKASDKDGASNADSVTFTILPATPGGTAPTLTITALSGGRAGQAYHFLVTASGTAPITFTATGLPPGLAMSSAGVISGTPTQSGTYAVTIGASNGTPPAASGTFNLVIAAASVDTPQSIPTLSEWALGLLSLMLGGLAVRRQRTGHAAKAPT